ncbi:MAG TPA: ankyrin repeat domain-containing protein [Candidatus Aquilonibacter sp.]|nr:ankyrin repeat domain-containing protein [Candidatus Aquilonibacter sp.]
MKKTIAIAIFPLAFLITFVGTSPVFGGEFTETPTNFPASISGTVRDATGAPAPGVRVSFHPGQYPQAPLSSETNTDQNGRYTLNILLDTNKNWGWAGDINPTNFIMAQDSSRNLVAIEEFATFPDNLDLNLQPGIIISGLVKDIDGAPVTNAEINLSMFNGHFSASFPLKVDAEGAFSYPPLPRGREYDIFEVKAKGYGSGYAHVEATNTQTDHYEFPTLVLEKADKILAGNVIGPDGQPVAGADIRFSGRGQQEWPNTKSDDKGHFIFESVCEGEVQLSADNYFGGPPGVGDYERANDVKANAGDTNIVIAFDKVNYAMPLINATRSDNRDAVISLLAGKPDINGGDDFGRTALYWAAENGYKDIVALLLTNKADVNAKDKLLQSTPLSRAAQNGNLEIVKLLLAYKSDVNALDEGGQTPLGRAMEYHHTAVAAFLRQHGGLEHGYDVERATGSTNWDTDAILEAVHRGDLMGVKKLFKGNPSLISCKDSQKRTPLILAALNKRTDIVEFFLANKADINAADMFGRTALHWAALVGAGDVAEILLNNGADIAAKADGGMTALHFAARNGFKNVVEVLVAHGADINSTNSAGITPLRAVETELQNGENAKEGTVQARIYAAKAQGYKDVIEWLRQHGGRE